MVTRECGKRSHRYPGICKDPSYKSQKSDDTPVQLNVEGKDSKATFHACVTRGMTHCFPVDFIQQEGYLMAIAQHHKGLRPAWTQFRIFKQARPFLVSKSDKKIVSGIDPDGR